LLRSEVADALMRGVRRHSACGRGGRTDGAAMSVHTPRGTRAHRPRRVLEVCAGLMHVVLTRGLLGRSVVRRHTAATRRRARV
jgi:hypothetical protein